MAITQYASPEYRYSDYDTEIMEDYDNRIGTYNKALTEFQALAEPYQGLVDTYNTQIGTYNTDLGAYKAEADAYNAAIAEYNAGPRTEEYAGVASPGQFTGVVPIFEGGAAPVAPEDPGFSGEDVDAFMKTANERAQQSGAANATALAVMNDPTQTYRTAAGDVNLAGMSGFGSTAMGFALGGYVGSPFADPMKVPGIGTMGEITGSNEMLGPQQAGNAPSYMTTSNADMMGTGAAKPSQQASFLQSFASLAPAQNQIGQMEGVGGQFEQMQGLGGMGQQSLAQQGIGGQFEQMNQMQNQMGQQFGQQMAGMQGAPLENYRNYLNQVYTGPEMQSASAALSGALEGKVQDFVEMVDEAERAHFDVQDSYGFGGGDFQKGLMSQFENQSQAPMERMQTQQLGGIGGMMGQMGMFADGGAVSNGIAVYMQDGGEAEGYAAEGKKFADDFGPISNVTAKDAVKFVAEMTPILGDAMAAKELWAEATSENPNWGYITALGGATAIGLIPGAGPLLAKGIKTGAKNVFNVGKNISEKMPKYDPNVLGSMGGNLFGEGTPDFAAELLTENLQKKIPRQKIDNIILKGKTNNKTTEEINKDVLEEARQLKLPFPKRAFDNPKVEYVNTDLINELIPRGNPIRYQPGTFNREGGQYYSPMSDEIDEFLESGKPTLKEDIYNEGFKEPLMIHVSKETGEVLLGEGHHRLHTALQLGIDEVPVYVNMKEKLPRTDFQSPIIIDTKDLKNYTNYSFKEIDFKNRIKRRRVTPEESYRDDMERLTGNYQYNIQNPDGERVFLNQNKPLMNERNNPPMREGYYRKTDGFADGGAVMQGVGAYQQFSATNR